MLAVYGLTKSLPSVLVSSKVKGDLHQLKEAVIDKCGEIGDLFEHFTTHEWIFDNKRAMGLYFG